MEVKHEKKHFLTEQEKRYKGKFMTDLMTIFQLNCNFYSDEMEPQSFSDMILSVLMMFTRETFTRFFLYSNLVNEEKQISLMLSEMFKELHKDIIEQIKIFNKEKKKSH